MNYEIIGNHTIGQLLGLYNRAYDRAKAIAEVLEEISDAMDSIRLAKSDLRLAINDEDDAESIAEYEAKVKKYEDELQAIIKTHDEFLRVNSTILSQDMEYGANKLDQK